MASFYYQPLSKESMSQQWQRYLHNKPLINNIEDIIQTQIKDYKTIIDDSTKEQVQAIQESTEVVCGTINSGFELVSDHLFDISYGLDEIISELNSIGSMLDWRLSSLIEKQRISNLLLGNIALLLRIPDIQKERQYHIEQGIKFLNNSFFDNDFYEDALTNLLKAVTIESTDYFALHRIGLIYLNSPKHQELDKAEGYFKKAAKYAFAESYTGASITLNHLKSDINEDYNSQILTNDSIRLQAAESYMFAGMSCYLQSKFNEAADLAGKAYILVPEMVEAGFTQAKSLSADNKTSQSVVVLKSVIEKDRFYSIKTVTDLDLIPKAEIRNLLEKFRQEANRDASDLLTECKNNMINESFIDDEIKLIEEFIDQKSFLHCKNAIDLINEKKQRTFSDIFKTFYRNGYKENRNMNELPNLLTSINQKVKYPESYKTVITNLFTFLTENTQWDFPQNTDLSVTLNFSNGFESKKMTSSLIDFIKKEKDYFEKLPAVKVHLTIVIEEIYRDDTKRRHEDQINFENEQHAKQNAKNNKSGNFALTFGLSFGLIGALIGAFIGFAKGCTNYNPGNSPLSEPFWYIPGKALIFCIIGVIIGIIAGIIYGQNED